MRDVLAGIQKGRNGEEIESDGKILRLSPEVWKRVKILIQVHDELVLEAPEEVAEDVANWLSYRMSNTLTGQAVEFPAEAGIGDDWVEAKNAPKKGKDSDDDIKEAQNEEAA
jgi:hypothetical protein